MTDQATRQELSGALDLLCGKLVEDEGRLGVAFPYVTAPDGSWQTMLAAESAGYRGENWSHGNWFCGFWVGMLVAAYHHSGNRFFLDTAKERMKLVAERADDGQTHDIGFIFWSSAVQLHRATGEARYADIALVAARRLRARIVRTDVGGYISSWGPLSDPRGRASSAIDTMANIPLLYWAGRQTGDDSFRLAGEAHAQMTRRAFIREDGTLYHAVDYDARTGARRRGYTFQGYSDESAWSRGTGWAVYGYAATAQATGDIRYLELAAHLAETWLLQLGERACPPWDFSDPDPHPTEDSSAAAIMAAAFLDLGKLVSGEADRALWTKRGSDLLLGLTRDYLARDSTHRGLLMHGCYSKPHGIGTDAAVMFGDYYFVEAIGRLMFSEKIVTSTSW